MHVQLVSLFLQITGNRKKKRNKIFRILQKSIPLKKNVFPRNSQLYNANSKQILNFVLIFTFVFLNIGLPPSLSLSSFPNYWWSVIPVVEDFGQALKVPLGHWACPKTQTQLLSKSNHEREGSKSMIKGLMSWGKTKWLDNSYTYISFSSFLLCYICF